MEGFEIYTLIISDKNGNKINEITDHKGFDYSFELNRPGECSFTTNIDFGGKFTMENLYPYRSYLDIFRYDTKVWSGVLSKIPSLNVGAETGSMNFTFNGYLKLLEKMRVGPAGKTFTQTNEGEIIWGLINDFQSLPNGNYGIKPGNIVFETGATAKTLVDSNDNAGLIYVGTVSSAPTSKLGFSFTGIAGNLASVKCYLAKAGSPTGSLVAKLYAHSGVYGTSSLPTGAALATSDAFDVSTLTTDGVLTELIFSTTYALENGVHYCMILEYAGGDSSNYVLVRMGSPNHSGNSMAYWTGSSSWIADPSYDIYFYVYASVVSATRDPSYPTLRDRTYPAFKEIYEAAIELTNCINGSDIEITPDKYLNNYLHKGHRLSHVFEYGKNISDFSLSIDGDSIVNNSIAVGSGEDTDLLYSSAHNMQSQEKYNLMQGIIQKSDVSVINTLAEYAQNDVKENGEPAKITGVTVMVTNDPPMGSYAVGDEIRVKVKKGWLDFDKFLRIKKISVDVSLEGKETVRVEFQE